MTESIRPDVKEIKYPKFAVIWIDQSGTATPVTEYYTIELARNHIQEKLEHFRGRFTEKNYAIAEVNYRVIE